MRFGMTLQGVSVLYVRVTFHLEGNGNTESTCRIRAARAANVAPIGFSETEVKVHRTIRSPIV